MVQAIPFAVAWVQKTSAVFLTMPVGSEVASGGRKNDVSTGIQEQYPGGNRTVSCPDEKYRDQVEFAVSMFLCVPRLQSICFISCVHVHVPLEAPMSSVVLCQCSCVSPVSNR